MKNNPQRLLPVLLLGLSFMLISCASSPFKMEGVNRTVLPQQTTKDEQWRNTRVLWGGMIIETKNFKSHSQIEMLGRALDSNGRPITESGTLGRFIIKHTGFLEPAQYAGGRFLSVLGTVQKPATGKIGEHDYLYPVILSEQLHLWPEESGSRNTNTQFHFGIGVRL